MAVKVDTTKLGKWHMYAGDLSVVVARMAGNRAVRAMRTEASKRIRARNRVSKKRTDEALRIVYPSRKEALQWALSGSGAAMPVAAFPHRQTKKGISVVIKTKQRVIIPHAFGAEMSSSHYGVFVRSGRFGRRKNPKLEKIKELYTTTISDVFLDVIPQVNERGKHVFVDDYKRLLPLEAAKRGL